MNRFRWPFALLLAVSSLYSADVLRGADTATVEALLESRALESAYNPELLDYLLEEGADALPEAQRKSALDQLTSALREDIEITPAEQKTAAALAATAAMAELFAGSDGRDLGRAAGDATYDVWRGWVRSAETLQRAGYVEDANAFFEKCIEIFPYSDLRGRCALGLAAGKPDEAVTRLLELTESTDNGTIQAALVQLGRLAGSDTLPPEQKAVVVERLVAFTGGLKKATYGLAACQGLTLADDDGAVATLQKLSKGMMNQDFFRCARRGLLIGYDDKSVVPLLEKQLGGGSFSTTEPWDRYFAATTLMEGHESSGYQWAGEQFGKGGKKKKKGFMKKMVSTEKEIDFKPALVGALVRIGGDESKRVLSEAMATVEKGSWLETWIAVGLLELGDTASIELVRSALGRPDWEFTTVRIATALARHDDESGIPALERLYGRAAQGIEPETGKAVLAIFAGEGGSYTADQDAKAARLIRLRRQIADALAKIDRPASVPILQKMLADEEASVRSATAYALARMNEPTSVGAITQAMSVDYNGSTGQSRNPVVQAHLTRRVAAKFPSEPDASAVLGAAKRARHRR